jgi:ElaB/YqjD/DUF883 family membrane-anchored ribosome-binding protein
MSRRSRNGHYVSKEITEIESLLHDLDTRLSRLGKSAPREGSNGNGHIGDAVFDAVADVLADTVKKLRDGTQEVTSDMAERFRDGARTLTDEAASLGNQAMKKITKEVEDRPLRTLAVAAGVGYLVGLVGRRH